MIDVQKAHESDLVKILDLLKNCDLTTEGLDDHISHTLVAKENQKIIGSITLEWYGSFVFLRSLGVSPSERGRGLGKLLTRRALDEGKRMNATEVYLLTITAHDFFENHFGFRDVNREDIPDEVKQSVEFVYACPQSAQAMKLILL